MRWFGGYSHYFWKHPSSFPATSFHLCPPLSPIQILCLFQAAIFCLKPTKICNTKTHTHFFSTQNCFWREISPGLPDQNLIIPLDGCQGPCDIRQVLGLAFCDPPNKWGRNVPWSLVLVQKPGFWLVEGVLLLDVYNPIFCWGGKGRLVLKWAIPLETGKKSNQKRWGCDTKIWRSWSLWCLAWNTRARNIPARNAGFGRTTR